MMFLVYLWQSFHLTHDLLITSPTWTCLGFCWFVQQSLNTFEFSVMALLGYCGIVSAFFSMQGSLIMYQRIRETPLVLSRRWLRISSRLVIFFRDNLTTFLYLSSMNRVIGGAITLFLFAFCPLNTALISTIILHWARLNTHIILAFGFFSGLMFLFSICIHMMTALFSSKFHAPSKTILGMLPRLESSCPNRVRLNIACKVWAFPNNRVRCYGINYALLSHPFGLISMATFAKVGGMW